MHILVSFTNTHYQTFHLLDGLSKTEHAENMSVTLYDPVYIKDTDDALKTVISMNPHRTFPWKYTQDTKIFQDPTIDRILFLGNFNKMDPKKVGWMMRNFVRNLKLNQEIKELSFSGTTNGLVQAECFLAKYRDMAPRIKCYSPEVHFGEQNVTQVYPTFSGDFYVEKEGKVDADMERQIKEMSAMTIKYHEMAMWIQYITEWMEGENVTIPVLGRCPTPHEMEILKTGEVSVLFLPGDELDSEEAIAGKWLAAARDTHIKIRGILKEA